MKWVDRGEESFWGERKVYESVFTLFILTMLGGWEAFWLISLYPTGMRIQRATHQEDGAEASLAPYDCWVGIQDHLRCHNI